MLPRQLKTEREVSTGQKSSAPVITPGHRRSRPAVCSADDAVSSSFFSLKELVICTLNKRLDSVAFLYF